MKRTFIYFIVICLLAAVGASVYSRRSTSNYVEVTSLKVKSMNEEAKETGQQPVTHIQTGKSDYRMGESVDLRMTITNPTDRALVMRFSSGQQYDFWIEKDGQEVWRWSRGKMFIQALTSFVLMPGETKVFEETWNQVTNDGKQVLSGVYDISGQLTTMPPKPLPAKTTIRIGNRE